MNLLEVLNSNLEKNATETFFSLGGIHDAIVEDIKIDFLSSTIWVKMNDLYANFLNLPEYQNLKAVYLNISQFQNLEINVDLIDNDISIYQIEVENEHLEVLFSPSGFMKLKFEKLSFSQ